MDLLTVDETARLLKINPITVRRFIASGRLPAVRVGRHVRIRTEAVEALLTPIAPPPDSEVAQPEHPFFPPESSDEMAKRRAAVDRVLSVRAQTPSIAPLTTSDLLHLARAEAESDQSNA